MNFDEHYSEQAEAAIKGWDEKPVHSLGGRPIIDFADGQPAADIRYKIRDQIILNRALDVPVGRHAG